LDGFERPKKPRRLPVVLTATEVEQLLKHAKENGVWLNYGAAKWCHSGQVTFIVP